MEPRYFLLEPMRSVERAVHRAMMRELAAAGYDDIRMPHIAFMAHMTTEGRRLSEYADLMQVTKSAVSQLVTYLEQRGLLERVPDPSDGRATLIRATPRADRGFAVARSCLAEIEQDWERIIGAQQLRILADTLHRLEDWHQATDTPPRIDDRSGS
jgi:DNA-binding MarR family transcriptional regulator